MTLHYSAPMSPDMLAQRIDDEQHACLEEFPQFTRSIRTAIAELRAKLVALSGGPVPDIVALPLQKLAHELQTTPEELWGVEAPTLIPEETVWKEFLYPLWLVRMRCERRKFPVEMRGGIPWYVRAMLRNNFKPQ